MLAFSSVFEFLFSGKDVFLVLLIFQSIKIRKSNKIMATLVSQLTSQQAHDEFRKLTDLNAAKNEELMSGEFGEAGGSKFLAKNLELAPIYVRMSQLCKRLNLPWPTKIMAAASLQALKGDWNFAVP